MGIVQVITVRSEIEALAGEPRAALATAEEALSVNPQERAWRAEAIRRRGLARLALGEAREAGADFRLALDGALATGEAMFALRAAASLASLAAAGGDRAQARALLAPRLAALTEGADSVDAVAARQELEGLES
jgi:hypothetical protein